MKNILLITLLSSCMMISQAIAAPGLVGTSFSYQGELQDNGSPANDEYDIVFEAYSYINSGALQGTDTLTNVQVTNGYFEVSDLDFGNIYDQYEIWIEISVRKSSVGGAFTTLAPRQRVGAVPQAVLAQGLVNGAQGATQWSDHASGVEYSDGNVGIGITPNSNISLRLDGSAVALSATATGPVPATFDGGSNMYLYFTENGSGRGYLGSYQTAGGDLNDEDFEIGTNGGNGTGNFHLVTQATPRVTINADGLTGIGSTNPIAQLHVDTEPGVDPLRIRSNGSTKILIDDGGDVQFYGDTRHYADIKQSASYNGGLKYSLAAQCSDTNASVLRSYIGTTSSTAITIADGDSAGKCVIDFPASIADRYWIANAIHSSGNRNVTCSASSDKLTCTRVTSSTGVGTSGHINVIVF